LYCRLANTLEPDLPYKFLDCIEAMYVWFAPYCTWLHFDGI